MYRKVPTDLMEGTKRGSLLSLVAVGVMVVLFLMETGAYFSKRTKVDLALDRNTDSRVRLNFNITMMDLKCDFATIDVVSVLGTTQNVSEHITKWDVDAEGIRQRYKGRNKDQADLQLFDESVTHSLEELYADGEEAINLDEHTLEYAKNEQEYLFVDFFASWCSHCQMLAPTWETLAKVMAATAEGIIDSRDHDYTDEEYEHAKKVELPVMIGKIDCVKHQDLCWKNGIMAYPTLRLFVDGEIWKGGDYRGHRTVVDMTDYLQQVEDAHKAELDPDGTRNVQLAHRAAQKRIGEVEEEENEFATRVRQHKQRMKHAWVDVDHPGCQLVGHLLLDRAPGNFHIKARSPHFDIDPRMTNLSHEIQQLNFGEPLGIKMVQNGKVHVSPEVLKKISPMDGNVYMTSSLHEAYHHYLKVVTTNVDGLRFGQRDLKVYQIIQSSQLSYYREDVVPEAKFIFDLSPISVSYRSTGRHWYDYVTSLFAIIGGTFTVVGMIESTLAALLKKRRRY